MNTVIKVDVNFTYHLWWRRRYISTNTTFYYALYFK